MDSKTWSTATVQSIQETCGTNLAVNSSVWQDPNPNSDTSMPTLPYSIVNTLCPDQCSGRGQCVNGKDSWITWHRAFLFDAFFVGMFEWCQYIGAHAHVCVCMCLRVCVCGSSREKGEGI